MPLVKAVCTNCGANLEVDNGKDAAICPMCGTPYIVEKAVNNYQARDSQENHFTDAARGYISLGNFRYAVGAYTNYTLQYPHSFEAWWGLAELYMNKENQNLPDYYLNAEVLNSAIENATKLANSEQLQMVKKAYNTFLSEKKESGLSSRFETYDQFYRYLKENDLILIDEENQNRICPYVIVSQNHTHKGLRYEYKTNNSKWHASFNLDGLNIINGELKEPDYYNISLKYILNRQEYELTIIASNTSPVLKYILREKKNEGCYIATCVYCSYDCPQVWALRRYRDSYLRKSIIGRVFIHCYYAISPKLVKVFGKQKWFRSLWKGYLDKKVKALRNAGYEDTPYED